MLDTQLAVAELGILRGRRGQTDQRLTVEGRRCMAGSHHKLADRLEQGSHHKLGRQLEQSFLDLAVVPLELRCRQRQNRMLARRILSSSSSHGRHGAPRQGLAQQLRSQVVVAALHTALAVGNLAVGNLLEEPTWLKLSLDPFMSPV